MSRSEVVRDLFVGSKPSPGRHEGIDVIVLAAEEIQSPAELFPGVEVIHAPLDDDPSRSLREDEIAIATKTASRVARRLRAGRRVLVTCAMGLNRSALIAALAMHEVYGMSADEIIARIRRVRGSWALSNPNFERLLRVAIEVRRGEDGRHRQAAD
jgi:protein-tyrosine phosphatase